MKEAQAKTIGALERERERERELQSNKYKNKHKKCFINNVYRR